MGRTSHTGTWAPFLLEGLVPIWTVEGQNGTDVVGLLEAFFSVPGDIMSVCEDCRTEFSSSICTLMSVTPT
jgi:hypothetical protein